MKKILLVDDDLKNSMLLKRFIEAEGYEVVYASNGKVGLELYRDVHPDLILLDINMPEMNGLPNRYSISCEVMSLSNRSFILAINSSG